MFSIPGYEHEEALLTLTVGQLFVPVSTPGCLLGTSPRKDQKMASHNNSENYWERKLRRRSLLSGAAATSLGLAAIAAGCGGDDDNKTKTPAGGGGATAPGGQPQPAGGAPKPGGTLTIHDNGDPASFDYIKTWSYRTMLYTSMAYPRLLRFATGPDIGAIARRTASERFWPSAKLYSRPPRSSV